METLSELKEVMNDARVSHIRNINGDFKHIDTLIEEIETMSFCTDEYDEEEETTRYLKNINGEETECIVSSDGVVTVDEYTCSECGVDLRLMEVLDGYTECENCR